jgi:hypothetical protein
VIGLAVPCEWHRKKIGKSCFVGRANQRPCAARERVAFAAIGRCEACGRGVEGAGLGILVARLCGVTGSHAHVLCAGCVATEHDWATQALAWCLAKPEERALFRLEPAWVNPSRAALG